MSINKVVGVRSDIAEMLNKIREVSHREKSLSSAVSTTESTSFSNIMESTKGALNHVNSLQSHSEAMKSQYLSGDQNVSLSQVVVASEKSKLAFEGLLVVRNKCLEAYKEIMNMPV